MERALEDGGSQCAFVGALARRRSSTGAVAAAMDDGEAAVRQKQQR